MSLDFDAAVDVLVPEADAFQRLALVEAMRDVDAMGWPPKTAEDEEKLRRLGAIAAEALGL